MKEEIENCVKIIDSDGNGTINFSEFALWWLAGREGAPDNLGAQLSNWIAKTQQYTSLAMKQISKALKVTTNVEHKDLRHFSLGFNVNNQNKQKASNAD